MFQRIRFVLAAFDRGEFSEAGLCARLDLYLARGAQELRQSRHQTQTGLHPVLWGEP